MTHHARIRPPGFWTFASVVDQAEFEALDAAQYAEIDGDAGGVWTPTPNPVTIGGTHGVLLNCPVQGSWTTPAFFSINGPNGVTWNCKWQGTITVNNTTQFTGTLQPQFLTGWLLTGAGSISDVSTNATVNFNSTSTLQVNTGALFNIATLNAHVTSTGKLTVDATGVIDIASSGMLLVASGGNINVVGTQTVFGTETIESTGFLVVDGTATVSSGGFLEVAGTVNVHNAAGVVNIDGDLFIKSDGRLQISAGAVVVRHADESRTGAVVRSGVGATTAVRVSTVLDVDGKYGVTQDVWLIPTLTGNRTYTLDSTTSVPTNGNIVRFSRSGSGLIDSHTVSFFREDATSLANMVGSATSWAEFIFAGGVWVLSAWSL